MGAKPVNRLSEELAGKSYQVTTIGDAVKIRKTLEAIEEGYEARVSQIKFFVK
jgi:hypothetical protein